MARDPASLVALVTGASGGLGGAIARLLLERGHPVAVHHNASTGDIEEICARYSSALVVQADLTDWAAVELMATDVTAGLGDVSVLVNCAGARDDGLLAGQSPETWRRVVDANLFTAYHTCRAFLPRMLRRRFGRIINVVSPAGIVGSPGQTAYSAAKAGVVGMTRSIAVENGRRGITANCVSPGFMETRMTAGVTQEAREAIAQRAAVPGELLPEEVALVVPMLIDADHLTGQVISVDGGLTT